MLRVASGHCFHSVRSLCICVGVPVCKLSYCIHACGRSCLLVTDLYRLCSCFFFAFFLSLFVDVLADFDSDHDESEDYEMDVDTDDSDDSMNSRGQSIQRYCISCSF